MKEEAKDFILKLLQLKSEGYSPTYLQGYLAGCYDHSEVNKENFEHLDFWITDIAFRK